MGDVQSLEMIATLSDGKKVASKVTFHSPRDREHLERVSTIMSRVVLDKVTS